MKLAIGALLFEGNTFSPVITRRADFAAKYLALGDEIPAKLAGTATEIAGAYDAAKGRADLVPLIATHGGAGGRVARDCVEDLATEMLARLKGAMPVDGVYLALHGAFVGETGVEVEAELLRGVRAIIGAKPLVVSCDFHARIGAAFLAEADALIGYRLYPHDDTFETGARAIDLLIEIVAGRLKLAMRAVRAPLLAPAQRQRTKGDGPMVEIKALADHLRADIVELSYFCVQPWIDAAEMGFTAVAVARDGGAAERAARTIAHAAWDRRGRFAIETLKPDAAIRRGLALDGPVVLADAADCVGGGASGDSAVVLPHLLREAPGASACLHIVDAAAARAAHQAGVGATLSLGLGNKLDPAYGAPVEVTATVVSLHDGCFVYAGGLMGGVTAEMGACAVLRVGVVDVLVASLSAYEYGDESFRACGIEPRGRKFIVVKNPMNYQQVYAGLAMFVLDTPGPTTPNLAGLPWRHIKRPVFPLDQDFTPAFTVMKGRQ